MGKVKTTFDISCCNKLGLCFVTFLQRKPSKHKHGGGGEGGSPLMTLMMIIMIVTNWHEHSILTLLARVFNTDQIGTSIQRLHNWHEHLMLTWFSRAFKAYQIGTSVQCFPKLAQAFNAYLICTSGWSLTNWHEHSIFFFNFWRGVPKNYFFGKCPKKISFFWVCVPKKYTFLGGWQKITFVEGCPKFFCFLGGVQNS